MSDETEQTFTPTDIMAKMQRDWAGMMLANKMTRDELTILHEDGPSALSLEQWDALYFLAFDRVDQLCEMRELVTGKPTPMGDRTYDLLRRFVVYFARWRMGRDVDVVEDLGLTAADLDRRTSNLIVPQGQVCVPKA